MTRGTAVSYIPQGIGDFHWRWSDDPLAVPWEIGTTGTGFFGLSHEDLEAYSGGSTFVLKEQPGAEGFTALKDCLIQTVVTVRLDDTEAGKFMQLGTTVTNGEGQTGQYGQAAAADMGAQVLTFVHSLVIMRAGDHIEMGGHSISGATTATIEYVDFAIVSLGELT